MAYQLLRPNAEGDLQQIPHASPDVDHWLNLDEEVADDATWVARIHLSGPNWSYDLYEIPPYTESYDLDEIIIHARVLTGGWYPESNAPRLLIKTGGVLYEYTKYPYGVETWKNESQKLTTNPTTGLPWTVDDIASLQIGIALSSDYGYRQDLSSYCSQLYIAVGTPGILRVTTQAVTDIEETTATGNGNITDYGGEDCDKRGFVYNTSSHGDPGDTAPADSEYSNYVEEPGSFGIGAFTGALTSLEPKTTYYIRAYAHNSAGYSYGNEVSFTTALVISKAFALAREEL